MTDDITYQNDDLVLREITLLDKEILEEWYHHQFHVKADSISPDREYDWFYEYSIDPFLLILIAEERKTLHKPIGVAKFTRINKRNVQLNGYIIGEESAKGKGYSQKLLKLAHTYVFDQLYPKYIGVDIDANNRQAVATYTKAGYKINDLYRVDNVDKYFMRLLNKAYFEY